MEQNEKSGKLLEVKDLRVSFFTPAGEVKAVSGISYDLDYDEVMGIVGESGSGKSQEAYSIMGLLQSPGKVIGGSITFEGRDVLAFSKKEMASFRGSEVAMIFQNPMTCLNPVYTVGNQLIEALRALKAPCRVELYSDSKYVIDALEKGWARGWKARGWVKSDKKPALNPDLWETLLSLCDTHDVQCHWVKGHAENEYNNRCDQQAVLESQKFK